MFAALTAAWFAVAPDPVPETPLPYDPARPPPELGAWQGRTLPAQVVYPPDAEGVAWVRRKDGHHGYVKISVRLEAPPFGSVLVANHCVDLLFPGHTHIMVGWGPTMPQGFDVLVRAGDRSLTFAASAVAPYASDAIRYIEALLSPDPPPQAKERALKSYASALDPNFLQVALWAVEHPEPLAPWTEARCRRAVVTGARDGPVEVGVLAAREVVWKQAAGLARQPARGDTPGDAATRWPGASVTVASWRNESFEAVAVVGARPAAEPLGALTRKALERAALDSTGPVYSLLRTQLRVAYTPGIIWTRSRFLAVAVDTEAEQHVRVARALLATLRDPEAFERTVAGILAGWQEYRRKLLNDVLRSPSFALADYVRALLPVGERPAAELPPPPPAPATIARALSEAFAEPQIVFVVPELDRGALAKACRFARSMELSSIWVVDLPEGGSRRHACGPKR